MFELTKPQTKILQAFFEIQKTETNEKGITSYAIRNKGIPGRTFDINKDVLLYHQFIRIIHEEKAGKQNRFYYELTPIGFFSLIKSLSKQDSSVLEKYIKFIPILGERWKGYTQILKPYEFLLSGLLKRSLNEINILPQFRLHTKDYKFRPRIDELTKLVFEDRGLEIKLSQLYYPAKEEEKGISHKTFLHKKEKIWKKIFSKESIQISEHMVERLIFLFYFNAIKLKYDDRFGGHLFNDMHVDDFEKIELKIPKEHERIEEIDSIKKYVKDKWLEYDKFWQTKRVKFVDKIMKDVFDNKDLYFIFAEEFAESTHFLRIPPTTIQVIDHEIKQTAIKLGKEYGMVEEKEIKLRSGKTVKIIIPKFKDSK